MIVLSQTSDLENTNSLVVTAEENWLIFAGFFYFRVKTVSRN